MKLKPRSLKVGSMDGPSIRTGMSMNLKTTNAAVVENALRQLIAVSPDLQTA